MSRRAVTLIELLVTMVIIAIIAAAIMGTAASAIEHSRKSRTQTLINRIHLLLAERIASYESAVVNIHPDFERSIRQSFSSTDQMMRATEDVRLLGLRELMKFELPDRWSDVFAEPEILTSRPAVSMAYWRVANRPQTTPQYQGAECLYLVIMNHTGDGEARTLFSSQDIGDVDQDGVNEFIDGWGNPISWLRWPAANVDAAAASSMPQSHDPLDPFRRDRAESIGPAANQYTQPRGVAVRNVQAILGKHLPALRDSVTAYRLAPLIYSYGPDADSDINAGMDDYVADLDPFVNPTPIGAVMDTNGDGADNAADNVTNLLIEY